MPSDFCEERADWTSKGCSGIYTARPELLAPCFSAGRLECHCLVQPPVSVNFKLPRPLSTHRSGTRQSSGLFLETRSSQDSPYANNRTVPTAKFSMRHPVWILPGHGHCSSLRSKEQASIGGATATVQFSNFMDSNMKRITRLLTICRNPSQ